MSSENKLSSLFDDEVIKNYLMLNDRTLRLAVSRISAVCDIIKDKCYDDELIASELNNINKMCCRIMQISELNGMLTGAAKGIRVDEVIDAAELLTVFVKNCSEMLGGICSITSSRTDKFFITASNDTLTYLLLSYLRASVLGGAKEIDITCRTDNEQGVISVKILRSEKTAFDHFEDFQYTYSDSIISSAVASIGAVSEKTDAELKLTFPSRPNSSEAKLLSPRQEYEDGSFSEYRIMLSDITE
ncbi:MAG: hypothetical protein IKW87_09920 [Ruminococcus sp.]|nr:hypothetical protein [Ruminococcus sp.]